MAITVVSSAKSNSVSPNSTTTGTFDTTSCDGVLIFEAWYDGGPTPTLSDNQGNSTPTSLTTYTPGGGIGTSARISYLVLANKHAAHTFTSAGTGSYIGLIVLGVSGLHQSSPFDTGSDNTGTNSGSQFNLNSETPSEDNCIVVTGVGSELPGNAGITNPTGYTRPETLAYGVGNNGSAAFAYKIQTTAGAESPQWTGVDVGVAGAIAIFKSAGAGGGGSVIPVVMNQFRQRRA